MCDGQGRRRGGEEGGSSPFAKTLLTLFRLGGAESARADFNFQELP